MDITSGVEVLRLWAGRVIECVRITSVSL